MAYKKIYYYLICLIALFVLFWGVVDLSGAAVGLTMVKGPSLSLDQSGPMGSDKASEQYLDWYYQKKMLYDRLSDSLARIIVAGLVFGYSRIKVNELET
jgi:hypothetical protein